MRHFGRRPLGSATSLPAMLNLGMEQKPVEGRSCVFFLRIRQISNRELNQRKGRPSLRSKRFQWARSEVIFPAVREWGERQKKLEGGGEEKETAFPSPLLPYPLQIFFFALA